MLRNLFGWFLLGGASFALAACCGNVSCPDQDNYADALLFKFNLDSTSTQGFNTRDVDTVYLRRYTQPISSAVKVTVETVPLIRAHSKAAQAIVLNNNAPFSSANSLKLNGYHYTLFVVRYPATSKPKIIDTVRFALDSIKLKGSYQGDGCCTYYQNSYKSVQISELRQDGVLQNTKLYDVTKENGVDKPITLNRF